MTAELAELSISDASLLLAQRDISPVDLTRACLDRIAAVDGQVSSFVTVVEDRALAQAGDAETEIMRSGPKGPLHGIPYALKDMFETVGIRTTGQSRLLADHVPARDCRVQERLAAAGGVLLGKTATWEFAHGAPSADDLFPPARNPWNLAHNPSGSSSGSAAAVAAGLVPAALGTDTGGSVRMPAAACGIAGLKPTYGRISRRGVLPNSFSHDHVGPLARTVEDLAILMNVLAGHDPEDASSATAAVPDYRADIGSGVSGLTIGVPRRWLEEQVVPSHASAAAFADSLMVMTQGRAKVVDVELPAIEQFDDAKRIIAMAELFSIYGDDIRNRSHLLGDSFRYRIMGGALIRAEDYIRAMQVRAALARAVQDVFSRVDLIMLPTAEPAGLLEPVPHDSLFLRKSFTCAFNVTGNPALSVCNGFNAQGMPTSLQIVGRMFDEATVLRAGHAYEQATAWTSRRPAIKPAPTPG